MKRLLVVLDRNLASLPPLLTIIDSLKDSYEMTVIAAERNRDIESSYGNSVKFIHFYSRPPHLKGLLKRALYKLYKIIVFKRRIRKHLKNNKYDLIIVGSAETALLMRRYLVGLNYILNIYELYDRVPSVLKKIKTIAQEATIVITPEIHRAHILKLWLKLKDLPYVLPNKPLITCIDRNQKNDFLENLNGKKIVLYQGSISKDRNIEAICSVINGMDDYQLILMGSVSSYLQYLLKKYSNIKHVDFVRPPLHLKITSWAHIGIVTYDYFSLNTIFCAPNKIWEYTGFGIPMIANNIPGLNETIGAYNAGVCIDTNNEEEIRQAIIDIESNYDIYKSNAELFYNSYNIQDNIKKAISKAINKSEL